MRGGKERTKSPISGNREQLYLKEQSKPWAGAWGPLTEDQAGRGTEWGVGPCFCPEEAVSQKGKLRAMVWSRQAGAEGQEPP